jgi:UDP-N-acetyl-2-amino-2-deoxyglucuronate dehydrogenase
MHVMRLSVIGLGRVFNHYLKIVSSMDDVQLLHGYDIDSRNLQSHDDITQVHAIDDIINDDSDLVCVLTPSGTHYQIARTLLSSGKNVLVEKPLCLKVEECIKLRQLAESSNCRLYCAFQNRFNKAISSAKQLICNNAVGEIISCHIALEWCRLQDYYNDEWHGRWGMDGGVIAQQAIHHIDALLYLLGPATKVIGTGARIMNKLEAEDTFTGLIQLQNGVAVTLSASTAFRPNDKRASITIGGTNGCINIGGVAINTLEYHSNTNSLHLEEVFENGYGLSHASLLSAISSDLDSSSPGVIDPRLGIDLAVGTTGVVSALYHSWENLGWANCGKDVSSRWGRQG